MAYNRELVSENPPEKLSKWEVVQLYISQFSNLHKNKQTANTITRTVEQKYQRPIFQIILQTHNEIGK